MEIVITLDNFMELLQTPPDVLVARLFLYVGWLPIAIFILWAILELWLDYIRGKFGSKRTFMLLAIDIPVNNEQTPKAVEQLFAHLAGAHGSINLIDKWWEGKTQDTFSFEIVSIEGYTQFIIRAERKYREFLESIVYAQYPDAEITEVRDYTAETPDRFPDDNYDIWGSEWVPVRNHVYPFKTYLEFEDKITGDLKDTMGAFMELFGSLRKGEQAWYQIILRPIDGSWEAAGPKEIAKVIGEKASSSKGIADQAIDSLVGLFGSMADAIIPGMVETPKKEEKKEVNMTNLKPAQKKAIEAIQTKISKIGFETKIRFIYFAEKEAMDKTRVNSFVGAMKQFSNEDINALKPDMAVTATSASYIMKDSRLNERKRRIMHWYKSRDMDAGRNPYVLNLEELATLWHFPLEMEVRAPLLQKVASRKTEAPSYLPVEEETADLSGELQFGGEDDERSSIFSPVRPDVEHAPAKQGDDSQPAADDVSPLGPPTNLPVG